MGLLNFIEQKCLERERAIRNEKVVNTMKIIASVGAGFTLGILFAPKSGKETRKGLIDATKKGLNFVNENINNAKNFIKDKSSELKETVTEKYDEISTKTIPEKIEKLEEKLENVKEKVKEKEEELKEKNNK